LKPSITLPVKALSEEPYASIICYPRANRVEIQKRIEELQQHGVEAVEFLGKTSVFNIPVLGKGYVGVVVVGHVKGQRIALKMRRVDADRESLEHEAELLVKANSINVGPKFWAASKNFLLMRFIDGDLLIDWLQTHNDQKIVNTVLGDILEQCWRLDELGLDHGELSKAPKHLIVQKPQKAFIVDFETASLKRKVINVTSVCQFLFLGNSSVAKILSVQLDLMNKTKLISALKSYKKSRNRRSFEGLLEICLSYH